MPFFVVNLFPIVWDQIEPRYLFAVTIGDEHPQVAIVDVKREYGFLQFQ